MLMEFRLTTCELPCLEVYSWLLVTQCTDHYIGSNATHFFGSRTSASSRLIRQLQALLQKHFAELCRVEPLIKS